jgi:hypothetical protein
MKLLALLILLFAFQTSAYGEVAIVAPDPIPVGGSGIGSGLFQSSGCGEYLGTEDRGERKFLAEMVRDILSSIPYGITGSKFQPGEKAVHTAV